MNIDAEKLLAKLEQLDMKNDEKRFLRAISLFSASIVFATPNIVQKSFEFATKNKVSEKKLYEIVLQSYLFLGLPRTIIAFENLREHFQDENRLKDKGITTTEEFESWQKDGETLCKKIYGDNFERLSRRVMSYSPELHRWMIIEGYGKVLSRVGLNILEREVSIVAMLMVENRPKQLYSHILGTINAGGSLSLLKCIIDDIGQSAGDGYQTAIELVNKLS